MGIRECLFNDECDDNKYDDNKEMTTWRMGRGPVREWMMGGNPTTMVTMSSTGRPLGAWGRGR
jgi:hypothetical protein